MNDDWVECDNGSTIGSVTAEGDIILRDEKHAHGSRVTLKQSAKFFSISCNIYGRVDHTRFLNTLSDAHREYLMMKKVLGALMDDVLAAGGDEIKMWEAIADFVRRFP